MPNSDRASAPHRSRAFLALWFGQSVSSVGSQVSLVAIPLIAVLTLRAGPAEMAILGALETAPFVLLSLPAGLIADRFDRRRLMIVADIARAIAMAVIPALFLLGRASFGAVCVVAAVVGAFSALFTVAQQAYVPEIVEREQLIRANQRLEISDSGARVAGPGIASALIQAGGSLVAVALDSLSYVVSALAIVVAGRAVTGHDTAQTATSERQERLPDAPPGAESARSAIIAGLRYVWRDSTLRALMLSTAIFNLASGMVLAQLVLFATGTVGLDAATFGLFMAVGNVGFLVGAAVVGRLEARLGSGPLLALAAGSGAVALWLIFAASVGGFGVLIAGRFVGALSIPIFNVVLVSVRQSRTPDQLRARVVATFRTVDWGTAPVGALLSGLIGAAFGVSVVMGAAAVAGSVSIVWLLRPEVLRLHTAEGADRTAPASDLTVATG